MLDTILAPLFKGFRGLLLIVLWGAFLIYLNETSPTLLDGWYWSIGLYAMFLVLALTWIYYGTGQHLKPNPDEPNRP